jgi:pantothenate synthetase
LRQAIEQQPLAKVEYAALVDPEKFTAPGSLAVLAVRVGRTRLIDNHDLAKEFPG